MVGSSKNTLSGGSHNLEPVLVHLQTDITRQTFKTIYLISDPPPFWSSFGGPVDRWGFTMQDQEATVHSKGSDPDTASTLKTKGSSTAESSKSR
jgi:hypothetical protein